MIMCLAALLARANSGAWEWLTVDNGLLSNHVHGFVMDEDGVIWIATRYGLTSYDGNKAVTHLPLSAHTSPKMYNDILSVSAAGDGRIFFFTALTLGVYDKHRDRFEIVEMADVTPEGTMLLNLGAGEFLVSGNGRLIVYDASTGDCRLLPGAEDIYVPGGAAVFQDRIGQIWIGTAGDGIFRYSPKECKMYRYTDSVGLGIVECFYQDSHDRIYVGTQRMGLYHIIEPYSHAKSSLERIAPDVLTDVRPVCTVMESVLDRQLWVGTNGGIEALDIDDLTPVDNCHDIKASQITMLWTDPTGIIWAATSDAGLCFMDPAPARFDYRRSGRPELPVNFGNTLSVYLDSRGTLWSGGITYPIACNEPGSGQWSTPYDIFGHSEADMPIVFSFTEDNKGRIYFGCYNTPMICRDMSDGSVRHFRCGDSQAMPDGRVMRLMTDSRGNVWVGTRDGIGLITSDGQQKTMTGTGDVMGFCESGGRVYAATLNDGIFSFDLNDLLNQSSHIENFRITADDGFQPLILSIASSRKRDTIYVGTEDEGLWSYDIRSGRYRLTDCVPHHCNLQVVFINEDIYGSLWVATNRGLYRLNPAEPSSRMIFTVADGLESDYFCYNGIANDSTLYIPTNKGIEIIDIMSTYADTVSEGAIRFGFTDMLFNNRLFSELTPDEKKSISGDLLPIYSDCVTIPDGLNNFSIEFSAFGYRHPDHTAFSYKLDGYDKEWQQSPIGRRAATYTNLPAGHYTFRLRAAGRDGRWDNGEKTLDINILPPWYLSWPAICLYVLLSVAAVVLFFHFIRRRERVKARFRLMEQERANLEELNHTKLRFFTNVTHELLTPLTVISAAIGEMRVPGSDMDRLCHIADVNVSRLVRLLRQILEFRKVETDNIKLRVNYGDISTFVANSIEALRPLALKKSMTLEQRLSHERVMGYFDSDKLDKILYNLISNAAKYSDENGTIIVEGIASGDTYIIKVSDNGCGIPKDKLGNLFKRFYDGDYREHNTSGTGIGLSLTHDLVVLCHGTISVDSREGEGTCFTVKLPVAADAFDVGELSLNHEADNDISTSVEKTCDDEVAHADGAKILVIEDNEDLLQLMRQVLGRSYDVITATDGASGLEAALGGNPDLILTDLMLPDFDGLELIRRLREDTRTSSLPIIVLTARRQDDDRTEVYAAGADVYLPKPFDPDTLRACISSQLASHGRNRQQDDAQLVIKLKNMDYEPADRQFLKLATGIVESNLDKTGFDIPTFAREAGVSQTHLFRRLKELTGMSPSHFIRSIRLKAACNILEHHPDIRIGELAFMVGFSDSRYFTICFKKEFGITPGEYKRGGTIG